MERGFLSQKGSGGGRDVKEKQYVGVASAVTEVVTPSVVDMMVEKQKISSLEDTIVPESFPSLTTLVTTTAGNAPGKSSYANITGKPSGKKVNVHTLFTPRDHLGKFNGKADEGFFIGYSLNSKSFRVFNSRARIVEENLHIRLWWYKVHVIRMERGFLSQKGSGGGRDVKEKQYAIRGHQEEKRIQDGYYPLSSYARVMIELRADVELKDDIVVAMPKITKEGHYTCNVRVEYEWKSPRCSSCKVFGHIHEECPKNTGAEYRPITKKPNASSSGNKKKSVEPTIEVSNSNPFDVLNSIDNDVEFSTNRGTTNLVNNGATSSRDMRLTHILCTESLFWSNTFTGETLYLKNLHIRFSESSPNVVGSGLDWLFDIDVLTRTMNYESIVVDTQSNGFADNELPFDPNMLALEDVSTFNFSSDDEDDGEMADMNNLDTTIQVSPIPAIRIHKDHSLDQVIRDLQSAIQTRKMSKNLEEHSPLNNCHIDTRADHGLGVLFRLGDL
nr:hypothetical protein [Tanacetum cinerariifolium]